MKNNKLFIKIIIIINLFHLNNSKYTYFINHEDIHQLIQEKYYDYDPIILEDHDGITFNANGNYSFSITDHNFRNIKNKEIKKNKEEEKNIVFEWTITFHTNEFVTTNNGNINNNYNYNDKVQLEMKNEKKDKDNYNNDVLKFNIVFFKGNNKTKKSQAILEIYYVEKTKKFFIKPSLLYENKNKEDKGAKITFLILFSFTKNRYVVFVNHEIIYIGNINEDFEINEEKIILSSYFDIECFLNKKNVHFNIIQNNDYQFEIHHFIISDNIDDLMVDQKDIKLILDRVRLHQKMSEECQKKNSILFLNIKQTFTYYFNFILKPFSCNIKNEYEKEDNICDKILKYDQNDNQKIWDKVILNKMSKTN